MIHFRFRTNMSLQVKSEVVLWLGMPLFFFIFQEIQQVKTPEELEIFMLKHGENIIDTLGAEVDRLEKGLKVRLNHSTHCCSYRTAVYSCIPLPPQQRNPEVRHVDLEIL